MGLGPDQPSGRLTMDWITRSLEGPVIGTTSARMHQNVCLLVLAFLPLPFPRSYVVLTRLPSTSTCAPFLIVVATYSASRRRNTQTRCHSVFEAHSSSVFFHDRCVATERTVNFERLLFRA